MIAPEPKGARRPPPLHGVVALAGVLVLVFGTAQLAAPDVASQVLDHDPGARAAGLGLIVMGWIISVIAQARSAGTRRAVGRAAAFGLFMAGAVRLAGPGAVASMADVLPLDHPTGLRALLGAALLLAAAGYLFARSPARR